MRTTGTVDWFSDAKGYGYLTSEDGRSVYLSHEAIRGQGFRAFEPDQEVTFVMDDDGRGPCALDVAAKE